MKLFCCDVRPNVLYFNTQTYIGLVLGQDIIVSIAELVYLLMFWQFRGLITVRYLAIILCSGMLMLGAFMMSFMKDFIRRSLLEFKLNRFLQFRL